MMSSVQETVILPLTPVTVPLVERCPDKRYTKKSPELIILKLSVVRSVTGSGSELSTRHPDREREKVEINKNKKSVCLEICIPRILSGPNVD